MHPIFEKNILQTGSKPKKLAKSKNQKIAIMNSVSLPILGQFWGIVV